MTGRLGDLGEFGWMDIKTRTPHDTAAHLAATLGWTVDGRRVHASGHPIGGLSDLANPVYPPGTPPHVAYYIAVDDIGTRVTAAVDGGARIVVEPFELGDGGAIATLLDPFGAAFSLWEGSDGWRLPGTGTGLPERMLLWCGRGRQP
ncbi:hypothetical protein IAG44_28955 [Streptomyces roseirectus]|uniref:VOC domain-containing protein n=1 Tax=Streptomyces roseirectus TaxID=2768066 RepID=A0A7H0IJU7_9ACTN|nr:hypothetical protein [Streptomyces roseirectus]QNP73063.1 hypothetical protein IAG44_28955 [Streptomyces roseirectus]